MPASRATFSKLRGALDEGQAHGERSRAPALLDDDAPADGGAGRERLPVDLDAQPHGSTHSGHGLRDALLADAAHDDRPAASETQSPS